MAREGTLVSSLYFMQTITSARLQRLRHSLEAHGVSALLETHLPNVYYLSGFSGDSGALLVDASSATLFTDGRFTIQAKEEARFWKPLASTSTRRGVPGLPCRPRESP